MGKFLGEISPTPEEPRLAPVASLAKKTLANPNGLQPHKALDCFFLILNSTFGLKVRWQDNQRGTSLGEKCRQQLLARTIGEIERPSVGLESVLRAFDDESMEFSGWNSLGKGGPQAMEKIEDITLFLVNFRGDTLEFTDLAA